MPCLIHSQPTTTILAEPVPTVHLRTHQLLSQERRILAKEVAGEFSINDTDIPKADGVL